MTSPERKRSLAGFLGNGWVLLALRILLGGLFLYASVDKLGDPRAFALSVREYKILPSGLVPLFAVILPWIEAVAGLLLLVGLRTRASAAAISYLLFVFTFAVVSGVIRGLQIDCGCFKSGGGESLGLLVILRDLALLAAALLIVFKDRGFATVDGFLARRL